MRVFLIVELAVGKDRGGRGAGGRVLLLSLLLLLLLLVWAHAEARSGRLCIGGDERSSRGRWCY